MRLGTLEAVNAHTMMLHLKSSAASTSANVLQLLYIIFKIALQQPRYYIPLQQLNYIYNQIGGAHVDHSFFIWRRWRPSRVTK